MNPGRIILGLCFSLALLLNMPPAANAAWASGAGAVLNVVVCQAGYSANDIKIAYIIASGKLNAADENFKVKRGVATVLAGSVLDGRMKDEGIVWGRYVYSIDFSEVTGEAVDYTIVSNGVSSYPFAIQANIWSGYRQDFMAYYRMQRNADTAALMAQGEYGTKYGDNALIAKGCHPAAFLDDAWDPTKTKHYDLVGGWFDAGDYGLYSENQWVTGQMALTYLDNMAVGAVDFDYDGNGIPDLLDEIIFGAQYSLKMVDAFDGYGYNVQKFINNDADDKGQWKHPEKYTDQAIYNGSNARDDRYAHEASKSVEGSAKMAGSLAATARALQAAIAAGKITAGQLPAYDQANLNANQKTIDASGDFVANTGAPLDPIGFIEACKTRALAAYNTAEAYDDLTVGNYPRSNYLVAKGLKDPLLWAEVELYLLDPADNAAFLARARTRIMALSFNDLQCTNYWNLSSLAMQELYPAIKASDAELADKIQSLLESRVNYFISSVDDTPYGVLNEFGTFGVNEPHISYVADTLRYYKLFKDINPTLANQALRAVKKGLYWVFGANPWDTSWVSGIGSKYTKFIHSRLDENAQSSGTQTGFILPGALVCGPNSRDTMNDNSAYPWYADRTVYADGANQWRYNEHSISIEIGLFYAVITLSAMSDNPPAAPIQDTVVLPPTGSRIDKPAGGTVRIKAMPKAAGVTAVDFALGNENNSFSPMAAQPDGTYTADVDISAAAPLSSKKVVVRTSLADGTNYYNATVLIIAPAKAPADGAVNLPLTPAFSWGAYPGATDYTLVISTECTLSSPVFRQTVGNVTTFTLPAASKLTPSTRYFWQVIPNNDLAGSASILSFTTANAPGAFDAIAPDEHAADQEVVPQFQWTASAEAETYRLTVAENMDLSSPVYDDYVGNVTVKQVAGLKYGTVYYWQVVAENAAGIMAIARAPLSFTTKADPNVPPGAFTIIRPVPTAKGLLPEVTLEWTLAADVYRYTLTVADNDLFASPLIDEVPVTKNGHVDTVYQLTGLANGQKYYWKVTAHNQQDTQQRVAASNFTVDNLNRFGAQYAMCDAPSGTVNFTRNRATDLAPGESNIATAQLNHPMGWDKIDFDPANRIYWHVSFAEDGDYKVVVHALKHNTNKTKFEVRLDGVSQGIFETPVVPGGTWGDYATIIRNVTAGTHVLSINALESNATGYYNPRIAHVDVYGALPGAFTLTSPANGAVNQLDTVTLNWQQILHDPYRTANGGADRPYAPFAALNYTVLVSKDPSFSSPLVNELVTTTSYDLTNLQPETRYYWKVIAHNTNGDTSSSAFFSAMDLTPPAGNISINNGYPYTASGVVTLNNCCRDERHEQNVQQIPVLEDQAGDEKYRGKDGGLDEDGAHGITFLIRMRSLFHVPCLITCAIGADMAEKP